MNCALDKKFAFKHPKYSPILNSQGFETIWEGANGNPSSKVTFINNTTSKYYLDAVTRKPMGEHITTVTKSITYQLFLQKKKKATVRLI